MSWFQLKQREQLHVQLKNNWGCVLFWNVGSWNDNKTRTLFLCVGATRPSSVSRQGVKQMFKQVKENVQTRERKQRTRYEYVYIYIYIYIHVERERCIYLYVYIYIYIYVYTHTTPMCDATLLGVQAGDAGQEPHGSALRLFSLLMLLVVLVW